jgi:sugar lactone lactonase YvrE
MSPCQRLFSLILLAGALAGGMPRPAMAADEPPHDAAYYNRQAAEAYQRKDYEASRAGFEKALELLPGHPRLLYNLAAASSLSGHPDEALALLERLAAMKLGQDPGADADFKPLESNPRFQKVVADIHALKEPVGGGEVAFRLSRPDFIPEGITHDPASGDLFVASVHRRAIARVSPDGKESDFVTEGKDGLWSVLGLSLDPSRRLLWACSSALPNMKGGAADEPARGALFAWDIRTGALKTRQEIAGGETGHDCNDLTVGTKGEVYASDARKGGVVRTTVEGPPSSFLPDGTFASPQGLALTPDGRQMYVADYGRGIFRVDLATKKVTPVPVPDEVTARGVDGLILHGGSLLAIQNGVAPHRVTRFQLDPAGERIVGQTILGMSHPLYDEPTLGVVAQGALLYVANSHWGSFSKDGTTLPEGLEPPIILRLKL